MIQETQANDLWKLLWEYDPNGLLVVDATMFIKLVNPAFCTMFKIKDPEEIIGQPASVILTNTEDFELVWRTGRVIRGKKQKYLEYNLYVNQVIFPIEKEGIVAGIMVDLSHELSREKELRLLKMETVKKVNEVVDHQMKVVQEIAGLLGETTAETKVSLLKVIQMLEQETV